MSVKSVLLWLLFMPGLAMAQSAFNGTWRPEPERAAPGEKPAVFELINGLYVCKSCAPPYQVRADGKDQVVVGNPSYDTLSVTIADARTVLKAAKKGGQPVAKIKDTLSADGQTLVETQTVTGMMPRPFEYAETLARIAAGPAGSHLLSGQWRLVQGDMSHHEEDTTYIVRGNMLTMSDRFGRSFSARLDGTESPYRGDSAFTGVSVKMVDSHTLEESDLKAGKVVKINTWTIGPDGKSIHARFDDTKGHIQEQDGHKVP